MKKILLSLLSLLMLGVIGLNAIAENTVEYTDNFIFGGSVTFSNIVPKIVSTDENTSYFINDWEGITNITLKTSWGGMLADSTTGFVNNTWASGRWANGGTLTNLSWYCVGGSANFDVFCNYYTNTVRTLIATNIYMNTGFSNLVFNHFINTNYIIGYTITNSAGVTNPYIDSLIDIYIRK